MTPIAILALLGLAVFFPLFSSDDDDEESAVNQQTEDPVDPVDPVDPTTPVVPNPPVEPADFATINGTAGDDVLSAQGAAQTVEGFAGADTLSSTDTSNAAFLKGGRDADTFSIQGDSASASGERGDDRFDITGTNATADGNSGDDTFSVDGNNITVDGGIGDDSIFSAEDNSNSLLSGGSGDDVIDAAGTNITVDGGSGDDSIFSAEDNSNSVLNGRLGDDVIDAAGINITINGNEGADQINYSAQSGKAYGRIGDDTLSVTPSDRGVSGSLFGNSGNDVLEASDTFTAHGGVSLNGGDHDDRLTTSAIMNLRNSETDQDTLSGGRHNDEFNIELDFLDASTPEGEINIATITDFQRGDNVLNIFSRANDEAGLAFDGLELRVAEDSSYTDVIARYNSLTSGVGPTLAVVRLEGVDNLSLSDINLSTGDTTTAGDDYINSGGQIDAATTISGGAGDDLLLHEGRDDAGPLVMEGGIGNDTLIADEVEFSNASTLDGGAGDDLLVTQLFTPATVQTVDTFITGAGADTIEISSVWDNLTGDQDYGITARVTDFTPGEDMIVIDTTPISNDPDASFTQAVTLTESAAGNYTDVRYVVTNAANGATFSGVVRLEGLTDLDEGDVGVALSDPAVEAVARPEYLYTATSEASA